MARLNGHALMLTGEGCYGRRPGGVQLARNDEFPCRVIRLGDLYRVSTADLLQLLGICAEGVRKPPTAAQGRG